MAVTHNYPTRKLPWFRVYKIMTESSFSEAIRLVYQHHGDVCEITEFVPHSMLLESYTAFEAKTRQSAQIKFVTGMVDRYFQETLTPKDEYVYWELCQMIYSSLLSGYSVSPSLPKKVEEKPVDPEVSSAIELTKEAMEIKKTVTGLVKAHEKKVKAHYKKHWTFYDRILQKSARDIHS
jgi:hypothetical protein